MVYTQDGVVLSQFVLYGSYWFFVHMYDPLVGTWPGSGLDNASPFLSITIDKASVTYTAKMFGVTISDTYGFLMGSGKGWYSGLNTPAQAYFVVQPTSGPSPLWVWFTDMSIAGTVWNWNFGDNSGSTSRSPYHTFISRGNYNVSQQLDTPSVAYNRTIIVGSKKISGSLKLLLLND